MIRHIERNIIPVTQQELLQSEAQIKSLQLK